MATSNKETVPDVARTKEGEELRRLLSEKKITHSDLGKKAEIGTKGYVSQLLSGHRPLNIETAARIAKTLDVSVDEFSPRLASAIRDAYQSVISNPYPALALAHNSSAKIASDIWPAASFEAAPKFSAAWPFKSLTPEQFMQISEASRAELEAMVRGMFLESQNKVKASGG